MFTFYPLSNLSSTSGSTLQDARCDQRRKSWRVSALVGSCNIWDFPGWRRRTLLRPADSDQGEYKSAANKLIGSASRSTIEFNWLKSQTFITTAKVTKMNARQNHIQAFKATDMDPYMKTSETVNAARLTLSTAKKHRLNLEFRDHDLPLTVKVAQQQQQQVDDWIVGLSSKQVNSAYEFDFPRRIAGCIKSRKRCQAECDDANRFPHKEEHTLIVGDDKDQLCWTVNADQMFQFSLHTFLRYPDRWVLAEQTEDELCQ